MDNLPHGLTQEKRGDGQTANMPGVYFHEKSGKWLEARSIEHADAAVRTGYVLATSEHKKFIQSEREKLKKG